MHNIQNSYDHFYLHVAKLFYAIAAVDGNIREEECKMMEELLQREWLLTYKGKKDIVIKILNYFYEIRAQSPNSMEAFKEFAVYKEQHEKFFTTQMRNTLWEVSCAIADIVNKKNKSELIMLVYIGKSLGVMK